MKPGVQTTLGGEPRVYSVLLPISLVSTHFPFANHENCITKPTIIIQPEKAKNKNSKIIGGKKQDFYNFRWYKIFLWRFYIN